VVAKDDTAFSLYYKLVDSAVNLLDEALIRLARYPIILTEQDEGGCYHSREVPYKGQIDSDWPIEKVERFVRAMYYPPHPLAELVIGETTYPVHSMDEYRRLLGKQV
jgi:methionyl-tRNA formyltransferase